MGRQDRSSPLGDTLCPGPARKGRPVGPTRSASDSRPPARPGSGSPGPPETRLPPPPPAGPTAQVQPRPPGSRPVLARRGARGRAGPYRLRGRGRLRARSLGTKADSETGRARPAPGRRREAPPPHGPTGCLPGVRPARPLAASSGSRANQAPRQGRKSPRRA